MKRHPETLEAIGLVLLTGGWLLLAAPPALAAEPAAPPANAEIG